MEDILSCYCMWMACLLQGLTCMQDINVLKRKLAKSFAMKYLDAAKKILGMQITRDKKIIN